MRSVGAADPAGRGAEAVAIGSVVPEGSVVSEGSVVLGDLSAAAVVALHPSSNTSGRITAGTHRRKDTAAASRVSRHLSRKELLEAFTVRGEACVQRFSPKTELLPAVLVTPEAVLDCNFRVGTQRRFGVGATLSPS